MNKKNQENQYVSPYAPIFTYACTDIDSSSFAHRCFMTGEYCPMQETIIRERRLLHQKGKINAFVVMSFSKVTDVIF